MVLIGIEGGLWLRAHVLAVEMGETGRGADPM